MKRDLKSLEIFKGIDKDLLNKLISQHKIYENHYIANTTIYNQGETCIIIDIILQGNLSAYSLSLNGTEKTIFEFTKGAMIGANLLFGKNNFYPMHIYCKKDCWLLHISKSAVEELLHNYAFSLYFIHSISNNSQEMNRKISIYTQKTLRENLYDYFVIQSIQQSSDSIKLPITKKTLAEFLGVQRPSLFRELKKMKDENLISISNNLITINRSKKINIEDS